MQTYFLHSRQLSDVNHFQRFFVERAGEQILHATVAHATLPQPELKLHCELIVLIELLLAQVERQGMVAISSEGSLSTHAATKIIRGEGTHS